MSRVSLIATVLSTQIAISFLLSYPLLHLLPAATPLHHLLKTSVTAMFQSLKDFPT